MANLMLFAPPHRNYYIINSLRITIRNAWITILIPLEYFDVMHMKSLRKITHPEFSDVMIT